MSDLTIREASQLIGRTPATIRRYIRSGRLKAEKEVGKFGEEYRINRDDLMALGFSPVAGKERSSTDLVPIAPAHAEMHATAVPIALYNELLMKHEQLLVQYGMIRAGGQKLLEYRAEAQAKLGELNRVEQRFQVLRSRAVREIGLLRDRLRQAEAQTEERKIEVTLMQEKIKRLEMAASESVTHEGIETRISEIREKEREIAELSAADSTPTTKHPAPENWILGSRQGHRKEDH